MKKIILVLSLVASGCESPIVALPTTRETPELYFIEQPGGDSTASVSLSFQGKKLKKVKSLLIGNYTCRVTQQTDTSLSCQVADTIPYGIYQVSAISNSGIKLTFSKIKYYAGAKLYGGEKFTDSGVTDNFSQSPKAFYLNDNGLHIVTDYPTRARGIIRYDDVTKTSQSIFSTSTYFTSIFSLPNLGTNQNAGLGDICHSGDQYFILDYKNNRILVYNGDPYVLGSTPQYVIGQEKYSYERTYRASGTGATRLAVNGNSRLKCSDTVLYVSDSANHRVLGFDLPIVQNLKEASLVLGQVNFSGSTANSGGTASASTLDNPSGLEIHDNYLFVTDKTNDRVVAYEFPLTNGKAATKVIGQTTFTGSSPNTTVARLRSPSGLDVYADKLYVTDTGNHRIMIFDVSDMTTFLATGASAVGVIGQTNYTAASANRGSTLPAANSLSTPFSTKVYNGKLFVADFDNYRVLIFPSPLPTLDENATEVMGQVDLVSNHVNHLATQKTSTSFESTVAVSTPTHVFSAGYDESRILRFPRSTTNYPDADIVLGRTDFTDTKRDATTVPYLKGTQGLYYDSAGNSLIAYSGICPAVSVWTTYPTATNQMPDVILGQSSTACVSAITQNNFGNVRGVCRSGNYLFVSDGNRILRFTYPLTTNMNADLVLGQASYTVNSANAGGGTTPGPNTFSIVRGLYCDDDRLIATDSNNHRVLIWNTIPTTSNAPADVVIGQDDFTTAVKGSSLKSLSRPNYVNYKDGYLMITDADNRRILVYEGIPTENGASASYQIGEDYFDANRDLYFPDNKNRVDHFNEVKQVEFYDDERILVSGNLRSLVIPFKRKD